MGQVQKTLDAMRRDMRDGLAGNETAIFTVAWRVRQAQAETISFSGNGSIETLDWERLNANWDVRGLRNERLREAREFCWLILGRDPQWSQSEKTPGWPGNEQDRWVRLGVVVEGVEEGCVEGSRPQRIGVPLENNHSPASKTPVLALKIRLDRVCRQTSLLCYIAPKQDHTRGGHICNTHRPCSNLLVNGEIYINSGKAKLYRCISYIRSMGCILQYENTIGITVHWRIKFWVFEKHLTRGAPALDPSYDILSGLSSYVDDIGNRGIEWKIPLPDGLAIQIRFLDLRPKWRSHWWYWSPLDFYR